MKKLQQKKPSTLLITEKNLEISGQIMLTRQLLQYPSCNSILKSFNLTVTQVLTLLHIKR